MIIFKIDGPLEFWLSKTDRLQHLVYDPLLNRVEVTRYVRQRKEAEKKGGYSIGGGGSGVGHHHSHHQQQQQVR